MPDNQPGPETDGDAGRHERPDPSGAATPAAVAPGNYDGVHLGHLSLLAAARTLATPIGAEVVVLTFDPHPARLLAPDRAPALLTTIARRRELLRARGADRVEVLQFDHALAAMTPATFVGEVLLDRLRARAVVVGPDFRFGRARGGDVAYLEARGAADGFVVRAAAPVEADGAVVSSTRVRGCLREGDVEGAARLLDRVHDVSGVVVRGDGRGRSIGVPTANLSCEPILLPADGVYAIVARTVRSDGAGELHLGVANLGVRPTFAAGRSVEVHLLDASPYLYDRSLRVGFVARLRGEQKFDGVDALKAQIASDVAEARRVLERADRARWAWI